MQPLCVIGSLNVDLTVTLPRFHLPGETITGTAFHTYTGGKGGNQAVAAARLGAIVSMVGKLGSDSNGNLYRRVLADHGVDLTGVLTAEDTPTGVALIEVDASGENRIALVPGANALVDRPQLESLIPFFKGYRYFLLQLEIPLTATALALSLVKVQGGVVLLDPAPAVPLSDDLLSCVDFLTPNETELALLSGGATGTLREVEIAAAALLRRGAGAIVAKLGAKGCLYVDKDQTLHSPGFTVEPVDTTAAGDSFNAGFATALARDYPLKEALRFANAVGALSTTGKGAQAAMPSLEQVLGFLRRQDQSLAIPPA